MRQHRALRELVEALADLFDVLDKAVRLWGRGSRDQGEAGNCRVELVLVKNCFPRSEIA